ncbi:MAG: helix-hairpin-helix domain-containing protein [Candidatus Ranarchaeia archaeon]
MHVYVDHREGIDFINLVREIAGEIDVVKLPIGDLFISVSPGRGCLIERKTVNDFIVSMHSNHLWEQLLRMMKVDKLFEIPISRRILVIQGTFEHYLDELARRSHIENRITNFWKSVCGAQQEILFVYDTPIFCAENNVALKAFLQVLIQREKQAKNDGLPKPRWMRRRITDQLPIKDARKLLLATVPSIGERLAENLLSHFHTIQEVASATVEDLQAVHGIGKKKAKRICQLFH